MTQGIGIVLRSPTGRSRAFEALFRAEVLPLWAAEFRAAGKRLSAVSAWVVEGSAIPEGVQEHVVDVEVPREEEHEEFDTQGGFLAYLESVEALWSDEPLVWVGEPLLRG